MSDFDNLKIRSLDGGLLLVFRELLRRKKASEVSTALGLSPSAISHALSRLRDLFDDPLFVRRPHGMEPTRKALALAPRIEALVELAAATLEADGAFRPAETERRFLACAPDFVVAPATPALVRLMSKAAPKSSFVFMEAAHERAFEALRRGEIDLAIGRFGAAPHGFVIDDLYTDRFCVVARRAHPAFKDAISAKQYAAARHVFSFAPGEGGEESDMQASRDLAAIAVVPRWMTVLSAVAACDGLGTVPRRLAERYAEAFGLRILRASFLTASLAIRVARRAGVVDEGADWFLAQVRQALKS